MHSKRLHTTHCWAGVQQADHAVSRPARRTQLCTKKMTLEVQLQKPQEFIGGRNGDISHLSSAPYTHIHHTHTPTHPQQHNPRVQDPRTVITYHLYHRCGCCDCCRCRPDHVIHHLFRSTPRSVDLGTHTLPVLVISDPSDLVASPCRSHQVP